MVQHFEDMGQFIGSHIHNGLIENHVQEGLESQNFLHFLEKMTRLYWNICPDSQYSAKRSQTMKIVR